MYVGDSSTPQKDHQCRRERPSPVHLAVIHQMVLSRQYVSNCIIPDVLFISLLLITCCALHHIIKGGPLPTPGISPRPPQPPGRQSYPMPPSPLPRGPPQRGPPPITSRVSSIH
eukprot:scaffold28_cov191-Alexandrium_tamarense.AAC.2